MGFLIFLIVMPIVYCLITSPAHFEVSGDIHYSDIHEERNTWISFIIWSVIKLIVYYGIEINYCLNIKKAIGVMPWEETDISFISTFNLIFIISSIIYILIHLFCLYSGDIYIEVYPFIHIVCLIICYALFLLIFSSGIDREIFNKVPYEESIERVELHSLGDTFVIDGKVTSSYRYLDIKIEEGYNITYSYLKNEKLIIDNFAYSKERDIIEEGDSEKAYLEKIKHFKSLEIDGKEMYDEYYSYHIYLPIGSLSEGDINLDLE